MIKDNKTLIGYALSDTVKEHLDITKAIDVLKPSMLELQLDNFAWNFTNYIAHLKNLEFISVHAPSMDLDLSSEDEALSKESLSKTIKGMEIANFVGASTYVIHPVNNMFLDPVQRIRNKDKFKEIMTNSILPHHIDNNHKYKICLENIEYPKYPSTLEESIELVKFFKDKSDCVKMVMDIPHIWNSIKILNENPEKYTQLTNGYPIKTDFIKYLKRFIEDNSEDIGLFHIAGFGENPVQTHNPLYGEFLNEEYIQLKHSLKNKPITMEIHNSDYETFIRSKKSIEEMILK